MFDSLAVLPPDSILGLAAACRADSNPDKVDLTLGVYMDETGLCPVFEAVQQAQQDLVQEEMTKVYMPPQGDAAVSSGSCNRWWWERNGVQHWSDRLTAVQTPGGCGAVDWVRRLSSLRRPVPRFGSAIRLGQCIFR